MYRLGCDLFGADEGGIGGDLGPDLRLGQPRRVALPGGVPLAKFGIDPFAKVLPDGGIGPILRAVNPPTDACTDPFDQTTQSGADHDTDADFAFIDAMPILRLRPYNGDGRQKAPADNRGLLPRAEAATATTFSGFGDPVLHEQRPEDGN